MISDQAIYFRWLLSAQMTGTKNEQINMILILIQKIKENKTEESTREEAIKSFLFSR